MIKVAEKKMCCGCQACSEICPQKCIEMEEDNEGFLYPNVNEKRCIECGKCEKVCPFLNVDRDRSFEVKKGYVFQNKDKTALKRSTSGGFVPLVAEEIVNNGGVVIGAKYDENFVIKHFAIEDLDGLKGLQNSKYVQSDINLAYSHCKSELGKGRKVLFVGTPCQVEGLLRFIGSKEQNLVTIDFACHGVPSPGLFRKYLQYCGGKENIRNIVFREKKYGYFSSLMTIYYNDGRKIDRDMMVDPMLYFFFEGYSSRPSCFECKCKGLSSSDIIVFDSWHGDRFSKRFKTKKYGVTNVIVKSAKGEYIVDKIKDNAIYKKTDVDEMIFLDGLMMQKSAEINKLRDSFFKDYLKNDMQYLAHKYINHQIYNKIKHFIKMSMIKSRTFNIYMAFKYK